MEDITMRKIFQYIMLAVVTIVMASCTSDIENTTATTGKSNVQLVVGEFPAFGDSQTRTIGTPDPGKTSWAVGDELLVEMTSKTLGTKYATFTYNGSKWELTSGELSYKKDEVPTFPHVYYAPHYKWESGTLTLKKNKVAGTDECFDGSASIADNGTAINVSFSSAVRSYSRLRIATNLSGDVTVTVKKFTPANTSSSISSSFTLTLDAKGNAYLYGKFKDNSSVAVKSGEYSLVSYTFAGETTNGKSYALDANVIYANNMTATEIENVIKTELAEGETNIKLILAADAGTEILNAVRNALKGCTDGSIFLSLIGCTEIPENGLSETHALKSIYLPDVTKLGKSALANCKTIETVNAPKVTTIDEKAFYGCKYLGKVTLGALTDVRGEANSENGIFDGINYCSPYIDLYLHERQKDMIGELDTNSNQYIWKPSHEDYFDTIYFYYCYFLGYNFKGILHWK